MSATEAEIQVDLDAVEAAEAEKAKKVTKTDPEPEIKVESAPKTQETTAKPAETKVLTPDEGLEKLKKQLEDEKSARIAAETQAREAREAEARAKNETQGTQLDLIKGAIASVTAANDALEEKYAAALASQDYAAAAKVQRELASNEAKLVDLNRGQKALESAPRQVARVIENPVEALCRQLTPESAAWVRAHPDFASGEKYDQMVEAHKLALRRGYKADTEGYFKYVERALEVEPEMESPEPKPRNRDEDPTADAARPAAAKSRQAAPPSAPVSRSGNGTGGSRPNVVTLTPEQVEMAKMMQMTPEDYAKQVVLLEKEGKLTRTH